MSKEKEAVASKKKQRKWMRNALYEAYQLTGALGAGDKALDNFYAAAAGKKPPHDDVLPVYLPLWETQLQTRIVHLQERLVETEARLGYTESASATDGPWAEMSEKTREQYRQQARKRLVDDGVLISDEHGRFHGHPWYYVKHRRKYGGEVADQETAL